MTDRTLTRFRENLPSSPSVGSIVAMGAAVVVGLLVLGVVVSAAFALVGMVIPFALLALGAWLLLDGRKILGFTLAGIGGLMLLDNAPLLVLLAICGAVGWAFRDARD